MQNVTVCHAAQLCCAKMVEWIQLLFAMELKRTALEEGPDPSIYGEGPIMVCGEKFCQL